MRKKFFTGLAVAILILVATGCGGYYQSPKSVPTPPPTPAKSGEITITASYPKFQPSVINVAKGEVVRLKISATGMNHTFTIDELGINIAVATGQTVTKEIKIEKAGTFTFYCAVPGHRSAGMQGTLKVTE